MSSWKKFTQGEDEQSSLGVSNGIVPDPVAPPPADTAPDSGGAVELARYTIYVPVRDNQQKEIPHVLHQVRQALTDAGLSGRTVIRKAQGDWQGDQQFYETEEMDLVMIDAPDSPEVMQTVRGIAEQLKVWADQEAIYMTQQPLKTFLI